MRPPATARLVALAAAMSAVAAGLAAWSGGFGARVGGPDLYAYFLAKQAYVAETFRAGHLPLWNPYEFCGLPLLGTAQGSALYAPVVLANMALSATVAMQVLYDLHIAAYILLTLVYLTRRGHGLPSAGVAAALATAGVFRGAAGAGIDHPPFLFSVTYLPAVLLAWDGIGARRPGAEALLALLAGVQWLPGYPEFPLETAVVLVLVAALEPAAGALRRVGLAGVLLALGALVAAVQILPTAETVAESTRGDYPEQLKLARLLFAMHGPWQLVNVSLWRLGGAGVVCLVLGLASDARRRLAWLVALLWALFPTNRPFIWLYELWPFSGLRFAHGWNTMAPFFAGCFAAAGVERLARREGRDRVALAVALGVAVLALALRTTDFPRPLVAAAALACAAAAVPGLRRRGAWALPVALVALHAAGILGGVGSTGLRPAPDLDAHARRAAVLRALREQLPDAPRVLAPPELRAGMPLRARLPCPVGYEPAVPPRRVEHLASALGLDTLWWSAEGRQGMWQTLAARPGTAAALGIGLVALPHAEAAQLIGSGYRFVGVLQPGDFVLHRPAPRFRLLHAAVRAADEGASLRIVTDPAFDPAAMVVLEEEPPPLAQPPAGAEERVQVVAETPERITLDVTLASPGLLVVSDTWYPGWRARVDGATARILRADHAFRALALTVGPHRVELAYAPLSFRLGAALSALGLVLVALLARARRRPPTATASAAQAATSAASTARSPGAS